MHCILSYFKVRSFELNLQSSCHESLPTTCLAYVLNDMLGLAQRLLNWEFEFDIIHCN